MSDIDDVIDMWNSITDNVMSGPKTIKSYRKMILSLLKEGFKKSDFERVFHVKTWEWKGDVDMGKFLRPETILRKSNFIRYLKETEYYVKNRAAAKALMTKFNKRNGKPSSKKSRFIDS